MTTVNTRIVKIRDGKNIQICDIDPDKKGYMKYLLVGKKCLIWSYVCEQLKARSASAITQVDYSICCFSVY